MQIDTRQLPDNQTISADVCIIGAGPAGLACANEFVGKGVRVALLESGGTREEKRAQQLSEGSISGCIDESPELTHLRQLGGTANHWIIKMSDKQYGFRYVPLNEIDFEKRAYVPNSGWPIRRSDLDAYYARAHQVARIGPYDYEPGRWETERFKRLSLDDNQVLTDVYTFGPTQVFTRELPKKFAQSAEIDTYLHATVTELLTDRDAAVVSRARVQTFEGKTIYFEAQQFVIASGGFGTPRLLLASRSQSEQGIGNAHDVVGRYYMDHSLVPSGDFYPHDPKSINTLGLYDMRLVDGCSVLAGLKLSKTLIQKEGLLGFSATLFPMPTIEEVAGLLGLKNMAMAIKSRQMPDSLAKDLKNIFHAKKYITRMLYQKWVNDAPVMPGFGQGGWSKLNDNHKKFQRLELLAFVEQSPLRDNRVSLTNEKDALGCPKIKVHFQWYEHDIESILRSQEIIAAALDDTGLGRFERAITEDGGPVIGAQGLHHLMGTTRMSDDPKMGVVDRDCKVHGMANLYIASSSVFVTSGYSNPTLTILALSIRLADEIQRQFKFSRTTQ